MSSKKDNIRQKLIVKGRDLVRYKGAEALTARKLAEASGASVGTIYNLFGNMDNYVLEQNMMTLDDMLLTMNKILPDSSAYKNLNRYVEVFVNFVLGNSNLWFLLYNYHLKGKEAHFNRAYWRKLLLITNKLRRQFDKIFKQLTPAERKLSMQVLWLSLFSLSSFLTTQGLENFSRLNKENICKLLLNTYLAGLAVLKRV